MLREKAKTPAHVDGYLEMALATEEADGDYVTGSAINISPPSTDLPTRSVLMHTYYLLCQPHPHNSNQPRPHIGCRVNGYGPH